MDKGPFGVKVPAPGAHPAAWAFPRAGCLQFNRPVSGHSRWDDIQVGGVRRPDENVSVFDAIPAPPSRSLPQNQVMVRAPPWRRQVGILAPGSRAALLHASDRQSPRPGMSLVGRGSGAAPARDARTGHSPGRRSRVDPSSIWFGSLSHPDIGKSNSSAPGGTTSWLRLEGGLSTPSSSSAQRARIVKGSGFVRGGLYDRAGSPGRSFTFRDRLLNLTVKGAGAPAQRIGHLHHPLPGVFRCLPWKPELAGQQAWIRRKRRP